MKTATVLPFSLNETLHWVAHLLPSQGPLREFIHHNTLHAFQDQNFHQGVRSGAEHFGSRAYLRIQEYRTAFENGRIQPDALKSAFEIVAQRELWDLASKEKIWSSLHDPTIEAIDKRSAGVSEQGFRRKGWSKAGVKLDRRLQPILTRIISAYLDQGISIWQFPNSEGSLWDGLCDLIKSTFLPLPPLTQKALKPIFSLSSEEAILECLKKLVHDPTDWPAYLLECHLSHRGWSGMVSQIEQNPELLLGPRPVTLKDFTALHLVLELGLAMQELGPRFSPFLKGAEIPSVPKPAPDIWFQREIWQRAFELSLHRKFVGALEAAYSQPRGDIKPLNTQMIFCIDERECSLRRHIEESNHGIQTFGAAGFFAVDALFQGVNQGLPAKYCPVNISPRHILRERYRSDAPATEEAQRPFHLSESSTGFFTGWLTTQYYGIISGFKMSAEIFRPFQRRAKAPIPTLEDRTTQLVITANTPAAAPQKQFGYTEEEQADRVARLLNAIGLTDHFAPIVALVGHGSSSVNNPHFAAYDCGACSGKPGAPNARAFAMMANSPAIRELVKKRGISIPDETHFIAGLHDTCRDTIVFFDLDDLPENLRSEISTLQATLDRCLALNARERARRFAVLPQDLAPEQALREVQNRSSAIFEPRPELGHATNAFAIVGRREWSRGLFLDRRAFLHSYDPTKDPTGSTLASILAAVIPVCGGINLEYYFSRVDNDVLGAGTKLPHNAAGLVGVTNGVDSDLRTGLPLQMVEIHEPVRLFIVVEQSPEIAERALAMIPDAKSWADKEWVLFGCLDPQTGKIQVRTPSGWFGLPVAPTPPQVIPESGVATEGQISDLPFYIVTKASPSALKLKNPPQETIGDKQ